jgi:hypothetical protein
LGTIGLLAVCLIVLLHRRQSGIYTNPSSLATAASLLHNQQVVDELRGVDPIATRKEFAKASEGKRCRIIREETSAGAFICGVVRVEQPENKSGPVKPSTGARKDPGAGNEGALGRLRAIVTRHLHSIRDAFFGAFLLGTLVFVIAYMKESRDTAFNNFMNSESFGPKFIMTMIGSLIHGHWNRINRGRFAPICFGVFFVLASV